MKQRLAPNWLLLTTALGLLQSIQSTASLRSFTPSTNGKANDERLICETTDGSPLCFNNGRCVEEDGDIRCQCPADFFGGRCERRKCAVMNPCYNGGLCEKTADSFACHCPLGFEGRYCLDRVPTICDTRPCGHGLCSVTHSVQDYTCQCHYGYTGANCTEVDHCLEALCLHGECVNSASAGRSGHVCVCERGWTGAACDVDVDECAAPETPCANGGTCVNTLSDYVCKCPVGFGGRHCDLSDNGSACRAELCLNGGQCMAADAPPPPTSPAAAARRASIWRRFNTFLDDYDAGTTSALATNSTDKQQIGWRCDCAAGFYGSRCEVRVDECALNDFALAALRESIADGTGRKDDDTWWEYAMCINGGVCVGRGGSTDKSVVLEAARAGLTAHALGAVCKCPAGFTGEHCERDIDECALSTEPDSTSGLCANGGQCINTFGGYRCTCAGGFVGEHCETNVDDCVDNICHPGSTCVDGVARYDCICETGRIGMLCEHENPCYGDRNLCAHGQCYPNHMYGNYTCSCDSGFTGVNCDVDVDECSLDANLCGRYGGRCTNTVGGYHCEHAPNCSLGLCQNDAYCLDYDNDYECICLPGFAGRNCETRVASPTTVVICTLRCANGGACRHDAANEVDVCDCAPNFAGALCEQHVAENTAKPTRLVEPSPREADCRTTACHNNGTCAAPKNASSGSHVCSCLPGFAGAFCELDVNECLTTPCQNQGRCVDLINSFRCDCAPGFAGDRCEVNIDDCANVTCLHGGRCRDDINSFRCECADGYAGAYCEVDLHAYERADEAQRRRCALAGCVVKAQNNQCDAECNFYACDYDGGDCALQNARPFERCGGALRSYCAHAFGNGRCDEACNVEECLFDGFDCVTLPTNSSTHTPPTHLPPNSKTAQTLGGELSLIVLSQPSEFFNVLPRLLEQLSAHLRASLRVSTDDRGRARIYAWRSDRGANESVPLALPAGWKADQQLRVDYQTEEIIAKSARFRRNADGLDNNDSARNNTVFYGIKFYLRLDVTVCTLLTDGRDCFTDLESASQYLSADNAKRRLDDLGGVQIYSAGAVHYNPPRPADRTASHIALAAGLMLILCAILSLVAQRRRRPVKAPVWRPKTIIRKHSKAAAAAAEYGYRDFVNSATSTQYSNLSSATSSNRSLAMNNNNKNNNELPMIADAPFVLYPNNFSASMDRMQSGVAQSDHVSLYGLYSTIGATGANVGGGSMPRDISASGRGDYGAPQTTTVPVGSYSSSSGVSSGQTSPNDRSDIDAALNVNSNVIAEMSPAACALHAQAASPLGIREPVDSVSVDVRDPTGKTALHVLVESGSNAQVIADSIERLLAVSTDLDVQDNSGNTALILAVKHARADVVSLLIERGADVNRMDGEERTALHHAIYAPHAPDVFRQLLAAVELDLNALERRRWAPLAICASLVHCQPALDFARLLVEHGADVNRAGERDAVFDEGEEHFSAPTPLHVAAATNNVQMIRLLVTNKANKDAKDAQERSPLCIAALNGNMEAVRELLTLGAEKDQPDANDQTAAHLALAANFNDIAAYIEGSKTARVNASSPSQQSRNGCGRTVDTAAQPRTGLKRLKNSPTTARKDSVKSYKAKRSSSNGAASNLMALTPPNSDQSTYSTTPSPSHTIGGVLPTVSSVSNGYNRPSANATSGGYSNRYEMYSGLRMPLTLMSGDFATSYESRILYPHGNAWAAPPADGKPADGLTPYSSAFGAPVPINGATYDALSPPTICDRIQLPYLKDTERLLPIYHDDNKFRTPHQQQQQQQFDNSQYRMGYGSQLSLMTYGHYGSRNANAANAQF